MHTLQLDNQTEQILTHIAAKQGLPPETVIRNVLCEYLAEEQALIRADAAYKNYLDGNDHSSC